MGLASRPAGDASYPPPLQWRRGLPPGNHPAFRLLPFAAAIGLVTSLLAAMTRRLQSARGVDAPFLLIESGIVALAMVLVGRLARAKRRRDSQSVSVVGLPKR